MLKKARLFIGLMYSDENILNKAIKKLIKKFGSIKKESFVYNFDFTDYYSKEMGKNLIKKFLVFKNLIKRKDLVKIKKFTNELERKFSVNGKRLVNIDPGYLTLNSLVLASTKERPHRIYLNKGIFADLNLMFKKDSCVTFPYTFPDFREERTKKFFLEIRNNLKKFQKDI